MRAFGASRLLLVLGDQMQASRAANIEMRYQTLWLSLGTYGMEIKKGKRRYIVNLNPTSARLWRHPRGVAWDAVPEVMVEYIFPELF